MNTKRFLAFFLAVVISCAALSVFSGCNSGSDTTDPTSAPSDENVTQAPTDATEAPTDKPTSKPTQKTERPTQKPEVDMDNPDVTQYDFYKYISPIWEGEISYAEAAFVREDEFGGISPIQLLYPIDDIISVRSADHTIEYTPGEDYYIDDDGNLRIIEGGKIPCLAYEDYCFELTYEEHKQNNLATKLPAANKPGYGYIRAEVNNGSGGMSKWTIAVTYTHAAGDCVVTKPETKSLVFQKLIAKLQNGEDVKVVSMGDSITDGWSATGRSGVNIPPYCPPYNSLVTTYMQKTYGSKVTHQNIAVSGSSSGAAFSKIDELCNANPDLLILAYGMNDGGGVYPDTFVYNINRVIKALKERCPDAAVVVVGTTLPNPEFAWSPGGASALQHHAKYAPALIEAEKEWTTAAYADVTKTNVEMFERKVYQDVAGSNSNHPNDYMHRIYAQVVLQTIFGDYMAE